MSAPVLQPLRQILKARTGCSLFTQLGLPRLASFKDDTQLYAGFTRAVPVLAPQVFLESLGKMLPQGSTDALQVLQSPNLLVKGTPQAAVAYKGVPLPVTAELLADALAAERRLTNRLKSQGIGVRGRWFVLNEPEFVQHETSHGPLPVPLASWLALLEQERAGFINRFRNPRVGPVTSGLPKSGSRWQWFNAMRDQLLAHGSGVDTLMTAPRTLVDFALYVAQQAGRFVPLAELLPNLQVLVLTHHDFSLQRTELGYLLQGLSQVRWVQGQFSPLGLMLSQADINIRQRLELDLGGQCFPEFIPVTDIDPQGRLARSARRFHAGQVEMGQDYLLVVTTASGLLGVNTGQVFRVLGLPGPGLGGGLVLPVAARGPVVQLNGLSEGLREDALLEAIGNINTALSGQGVFIREALLGHVVAERLPFWVLEISRPLGEVDATTLQSIAKRLHAELDLRSPSYRNAYRGAALRPPKVHMVPMGTFAAAASNATEHAQFDHSADAAQCRKILGVAWESQVFEAI
ncbi:MAG: GH3 auxin-responsive promoter family protein [Alphaproteobacteria bacterium]|nr:GH3 auxin-responsive promoter family protein [Alphaproteobacteria bacterium]